MGNIKYYNEFIKEEQSFGEKLQFQLNQFRNRKGNLENLILNNLDEDLGDKVNSITEDNPFLMHYGNHLKIKRKVKKKEKKIKDINTNLSNLRKDLSLVNKLNSNSDKEKQKTTINEKISKAQDQKKNLEEEINDLQSRASDLEKEISELIKNREDQLKDIQSNV